MRHCQWAEPRGFPGLSLPFGQSPEGLPINIQLIARPYEEELLLAVVETLEQSAAPGKSRRKSSSCLRAALFSSAVGSTPARHVPLFQLFPILIEPFVHELFRDFKLGLAFILAASVAAPGRV